VPFDQAPTGTGAPDPPALLRTRRRRPAPYPVLETILRSNGISRICTLPLFTARRDLGGLNFGSMRKNAYSAEDIEFMQQVARQVAVAVDNALNHEAARAYEEQLARERDRLSALLEINNAVVSCLSAKPLFQAISASLRRTFNLDYASLLIYDAEFRALRLETLRLPHGERRHPRKCRGSRSTIRVPATCFRTREGRVFSQRRGSRRHLPIHRRHSVARRLRSSAACPDLARRRAGHPQPGFAARRAFFTGDLQFFSQAAAQVAIALENALSYQRIEELNARLAEEKVYLEDEIRTDNRFEEIVGQSRVLKAVLKQVETVAPTDSTVLIYGETGTGKELLARAIHDLELAPPGHLRQAELRRHPHRPAGKRNVRP
jgi:formate hydrogenlyase transcriptional activator